MITTCPGSSNYITVIQRSAFNPEPLAANNTIVLFVCALHALIADDLDRSRAEVHTPLLCFVLRRAKSLRNYSNLHASRGLRRATGDSCSRQAADDRQRHWQWQGPSRRKCTYIHASVHSTVFTCYGIREMCEPSGDLPGCRRSEMG